ncbi:cellular tumor antigen p53-like isoform X2 [Uloborus diversus]|uniref:cellular tumor antigen p53-like isoform X2 n=1 Tax=Uloborus diversus TaxID=327109 RepID=UPI0024090F80|nr:cellular tumor antigen p53-like isoform X2 [Uloborus diversus]
MPGCAVWGCSNNNEKTGSSVSYHRFPVNDERRQKWLLQCGRDAHTDSSSLRICSEHFADEDFERDLQGELMGLPLKRRLKKDVDPHVNLIKIKQEPIDEDEYYQADDPMSPRTTWGQNEEQIGVVAANIQVPFEVSSSSHHVLSSLPASQNWPGDYGFTVSFNQQEKNTKGVAWTFSKIKDKLYVGKDVACPINFSVNTVLPDDFCVRAMALYSSPEQISDVVQRCVNHSMDELRKGLVEAQHLIRCDSSMASYEIDPITLRHSVSVPFENPQAGQNFSTYIYKFACFGSCSGGPNRRPLMIVFTLERKNQVVGRRKIDVKICACPGRDRKSEEDQFSEAMGRHVSVKRKEPAEFVHLSDTLEFTKSVVYPPPKKTKKAPNKDGHYTVTADDYECYEFLKNMKKLYDICKVMKNLPPDIKRALIRQQRKNEE